MSKLRRLSTIDRKRLAEQSPEEAAEYWGRTDASALLEDEPVKVQVERPAEACGRCGSERRRVRRVDLPIMEGRLIVPRARVLYCPDCRTSVLDPESEEAISSLLSTVRDLDRRKLVEELYRGSERVTERFADKARERNIATIYFPTRSKGHRVAKVSIRQSDPLFPVLRRMGSEDIRRALGLEYFEELEHAARAASRTVSQYLRLTLTEKLLGGRRRRPGPVVSVAARRPLKHSER
jgi:hypothetical protein